ncbi:hypothetical protein [Nonomuraea salmonea]|uniref:hypothetical protein n=1 Tax=Nonomuraea salmonea TaxID=46181 RepID=UPI002FEC92BF
MSWRPITLVAVLCLALTAPGTAAADDPPPEVEQRAGTRAPAEVHGLSEPAQAGDPVAAAKAHLADPPLPPRPRRPGPAQDGRGQRRRDGQVRPAPPRRARLRRPLPGALP